jgi:methyl-accepting chemotaxis protein PixJ
MTQLGIQFGLALQQAEVIEQVKAGNIELQQLAKQERAVNRVIEEIRQSLDIETIFQTAVKEVRKLLNVERVTIYRFRDDYFGDFVSEAELPGFPRLVGSGWEDPYLQEHRGGRFRDNEALVCDDIYRAGLTDCHVEALDFYGVKACAVVSIFRGGQLWGLLSAFQNTSSRHWQESEVKLLRQIAAQIGVALLQAESLALAEAKNVELDKLAKQEQALNRVISKIRDPLDIDEILQIATLEVRKLLSIERVTIYKFREDYFGDFLAESEFGGFPKLVGSGWEDPYLNEHQGGRFRNDEALVCDDIHNAGLTDCHVEALEFYSVKSCAVVSIFKGKQLWGLLSAFQNTSPRHWEESEVNLLRRVSAQIGIALQQAEYLAAVETKSDQLAQLVERGVTFTKLVYQLGQQLLERTQEGFSPDSVFRLAVAELRKRLKADRIAVYQFNPDWSGEFVAESVGAGWTPLITETFASDVTDCNNVRDLGSDPRSRVEDTYLQQTQGGRYRQNRQGFSVNDIYTAGFSECYIETLEQFQARAYVTVPIFAGEKLWGLLGAYQNSGPRQWDETEITFLAQVGVQIGVAIQQADYAQQVRVQQQQLAETVEREKEAKEGLQLRALRLLQTVEPVLQGDLTVRAPLSEDEVGTIADGYNTTIQTLRELVRQVKGAAERVGQTSEGSAIAVTQLSQQANQQYQEMAQAVKELRQMVDLVQVVANNAKKVEQAVQAANQTVQAGDSVMEQTVDGIRKIRETVSETAKKMKSLSDASQKIAKVVSLIDNFANQTNLLAINAAIEATRAGEYGRGFVVVADEIRSLAYQSASATTEIERLVQEIQAETKAVIEVTEIGIMEVVQGTGLVNQTRQSLNAIAAATQQISERVQGITHSTASQKMQSESVTKAMISVAEIAKKTSEDSAKISTSFQTQLETSQELQASISQFKVD